MAKRKGPSTSGPRTRGKAAKEKRDATEAENARRLDKLPQEVWEKILDDIDENDLFPLALSCRYFRQKQKELVEGTGQSGPGSEKPRLALKTSLQRKFEKLEGLPASAEYLRFCYKEKDIAPYNYHRIVCIMAFHGYLPLLQELQDEYELLGSQHLCRWGVSSQSLLLLFVPASDFILAFSSSQRAEVNWRP